MTLELQVRRIKTVRAMSRSRSSSVTSGAADAHQKPSSLVHTQRPEAQSLRKRISSALLGVKGSMLPDNKTGYGKGKDDKEENPVARLKLLLVSLVLNIGLALY